MSSTAQTTQLRRLVAAKAMELLERPAFRRQRWTKEQAREVMNLAAAQAWLQVSKEK